MTLFGGWAEISATRRRYASGAWLAGLYTAGASTDLVIALSKHPPSGETLDRLEAGQRARKAWTIYTSTDLLTVSLSSASKADEILLGGETYEVVEVADRRDGDGLDHVKALILRVQE